MSNPYLAYTDLPSYGLPASALGAVPTAVQQIQCDVAAGIVDSHLRGRVELPLATPIDPAIIGWCGAIAAWNILSIIRGANQANPGDRALRDAHDSARKDLLSVQRQALHPVLISAASASAPNAAYTQPQVQSQSVSYLDTGASLPQRGW